MTWPSRSPAGDWSSSGWRRPRHLFGAYVEYACWNKHSLLAPLPTDLTCPEAAALPYGGLLAVHYLCRQRHRCRGHEGVRRRVYGAVNSSSARRTPLTVIFDSVMWGQISQGAEMQLTINHPGASAAWADALFVSVLQRSDNPGAGQVRKAIAAAVRAYGGLGCVQRVAQEFGDHPEAAVDRMRWARAVADQLFAAPPVPASQNLRRQPGQPVASLPGWRLAG